MVAVVIAITGGFVIDAGPLYLSAHRLLSPLVIAAAAYLLAARQGHTAIVAADAALFEFVHRHALAIAIVLAAVAAGVGIAFNTYVVAASDPSAYISQARLITKGDLVVPVPLASQVSWPMPEMSFAPLGYRPGPQPAEIVPTIERMATVAEKMVGTVAGIIAERDVEGARQLEEDDEEMDQLRRSSFRLMLADSWPHGVEPAVDIALLGRYYERIADHAVSLARRVVYLVTGETVTTVDHL